MTYSIFEILAVTALVPCVVWVWVIAMTAIRTLLKEWKS